MSAPQLVESSPLSMKSPMDRKVNTRGSSWRLWAGGFAALISGVVALYYFLQTLGVHEIVTERGRVTISTVIKGSFADFIPIRGSVTPLTTVYLDAMEGGRVESIYVEEGAFVEQGNRILAFGNTALQLDVISREAQISEQLNDLRNTRLAMEQNRLALRQDLIEIDYQITRLTRLTNRRAKLATDGLISRADLDATSDELDYYQSKRKPAVESLKRDAMMRGAQIESLEAGIKQLQSNLVIARKNLDNLVIKAPISGQLTALDAEVGQSKPPGQQLGQIDDTRKFKVVAEVDEFYVTRLLKGQRGEFVLDGKQHALIVGKIYPQIRDGKFRIDLSFVGEMPPNLRRGQTLQIRVALGDAERAMLLQRGSFLQDTGGNWAFVLNAAGTYAERRDIRIGRRNPEFIEVLDGLNVGDRVITSGYTSFGEMNRIQFKDE